jgi:hypothetical protein
MRTTKGARAKPLALFSFASVINVHHYTSVYINVTQYSL